MKEQEYIDFNRIAEAITYLQKNFRGQPNLDEVAERVNLSPYHFQRLFTEWAGTSPKKFLQYISIEHAKKLIRENKASLFDAALETGLSGTGRLHDLFVSIEGMTPGEYKYGGKSLSINYSFTESPFGNMLVASTHKGLCHMSFIDDEIKAIQNLQNSFPNATWCQQHDRIQQNALSIFQYDWEKLSEIKLHLKASAFQLKVWESLLKIPVGNLTTYGTISKYIHMPKASRAVGTAIGSNPVAFLIPCHRVIQSTGLLGGYHWGSTRKAAMIGWESAKINS